MKAIKRRFTQLVFRLADVADDDGHDKHAYHLDYENEEYRQAELVRIIRDALPHFALTPSEFKEQLDNYDVGEMYRMSWARISKAQKDKKGDYGELLLFLFLKVFYKAERFVTKVRLRSSSGDQIKGFDCAHFTVDDDGEVRLWLGEVKFYKSFSAAATDICTEIEGHVKSNYLKSEFSVLFPNVEQNAVHPVPEKVIEFLGGSVSLDKVKIVIPALITYESACVKAHKEVCEDFLGDLRGEMLKKFNKLNEKNLTLPKNIEVFFILMSLEDVGAIKEALQKIEEAGR